MNPHRSDSTGTTAAGRGKMPFGLTVAALYLFCVLLFGSLLFREIRHLERNTEALARERGAVLFQLIEITRDWNAQHGGVYVPVTKDTQPNPYLKDPRRDLTATDGTKLTKVNPAFMTRQIAEIAEQQNGVRFHITSLKPIRPANRADAWETLALKAFEDRGEKERLELVDSDDAPSHRYMAPLRVKPACMKCHEDQGYRVGDIRGGISVTMPAAGLLEIEEAQKARALRLHVLAGLLIALAGHYLAHRSRQHFLAIKAVNAGQERLIADRTQALAGANLELRREIAERRESEERYRAVVEFATDGILVTEDGLVAFANRRMGEMIGCDPAELIGTDGLDLIHPSDRERVAQGRENRLKGLTTSNRFRARLLYRQPERTVIADFSIRRLDTDPEQPGRVLVSVRDVTAALEAEHRNRISGAVFDNAAEAIVVTDGHNRIVQVNPAFTAITGYTPNEVRGQNPKLLGSGRHDDAFYRRMWESLTVNGQWQGEIWNRRKNGDVFIEWLSITRIPGSDGEGGYVATFSDITQRKEAEELIRHKAHHDPLTDLPNRTLFADRLQSALSNAHRYRRLMALVYVDLDRFKDVNDTLGHNAGDALLIEASRRLGDCLRASDTVARLGGDEFAMILGEITSAGDAEEVARRALEALAQPFVLKEGTAEVSGSIGIAFYPDHGSDATSLQRHADAALYAAKSDGRNRYRVYSISTGRG